MAARFRFGENWLKFAADLRPEQIAEAEQSIARLLGRIEKRLYAGAPAFVQTPIRGLYKGALFARMMARGLTPRQYLVGYRSGRGMSWERDVHDWLGGYPYESASPAEIKRQLDGL